jgi:PelA/Pel-15E family pectate lyase
MTFNDHVMTTVVLLLWDLVEQRNQFSSGILDSINSTQLSMALDAGMQFILDTQIIVNGTPTIWAQQYNRSTLEPESARSWELPCRTPNESEGIVAILLNWPDRTPEIINATWGAVDWYEQNAIEDVWFDKANGEIIVREGALMFYRYYNVSDDQFFLANSQSEKIYSLYDLYPEVKRTTYRWAGEWGSEMLVETRKIAVEDRH